MTSKHLDRMRIRGVSATEPEATGLLEGYGLAQVRRQAVRALAMKLGNPFSVSELQANNNKLAQLAAVQQLRVLGQPLLVLKGDPTEIPSADRVWEVLLPVRGPAKPDEEAGVYVTRTHSGLFIETMTRGGVRDLENLYGHFISDFLPRRKHQLSSPLIYHRVLDGLQSDDIDELSLAVYIPIHLSLRPVSPPAD